MRHSGRYRNNWDIVGVLGVIELWELCDVWCVMGPNDISTCDCMRCSFLRRYLGQVGKEIAIGENLLCDK